MRLIVTLLFLSLMPALWAQDSETSPTVGPLEWPDRNHLDQQRQFVDDLARSELGQRVRGDRSDLELLQRIVNRKLIAPDETQSLQALGAVLGDIYVAENSSLEWRIYEDQKGRSRAVCVRRSNNCVFPITMLSRRIAAGLTPNVEEIYNKGIQALAPYLPRRPFQDR